MATTEQGVPNGAVFIGELNVSEALGVAFREPDGLRFLDTPLAVYRSKQAGRDRFDVVIPHEPLDGRQLFDFLSEVAPNKRTEDAIYLLAELACLLKREFWSQQRGQVSASAVLPLCPHVQRERERARREFLTLDPFEHKEE